jgi:hypothetical protein
LDEAYNLFTQSWQICSDEGWADGVKYADHMIGKIRQIREQAESTYNQLLSQVTQAIREERLDDATQIIKKAHDHSQQFQLPTTQEEPLSNSIHIKQLDHRAKKYLLEGKLSESLVQFQELEQFGHNQGWSEWVQYAATQLQQVRHLIQEKERIEQDELEQKQREKERIEQKKEQERLKLEQQERERLEKERQEQERLDQQQREKAQLEQAQLEQQRQEQELLDQKLREQERLDQEEQRIEKERQERLRIMEADIANPMDYHGTILVKADFEVLLVLELLLGEIIPKVEDVSGDTFGFTEYEYRVNKLGLYGKGLMFLPENIGNLKNLEVLRCYRNKLTALPDCICELTSLTYLILGANDLNFFPEVITEMPWLKFLDLSENRLNNLSDNIGNLQSLEYLNLQENCLSTLPESLGQLKTLQTLVISYNKFLTLPENIEEILTNLEQQGCSISR